MLIGQLTPPDALTWSALACRLPWTKVPGQVHATTRPTDTALHEILKAAGIEERAARKYILMGPFTDLMVTSPSELLRNHGKPARAIEVAAEHDIRGRSLVDLATWLSLTDHQAPLPRQEGVVIGDSRGGRRYLSQGRALLRALGVWPWAHVEDWSRTRRWWLDPAVFAALCSWHDKAWMRAAEKLAYSARARYGQAPSYIVTVGEHNACLGFRARLAELGAEEKLRAERSTRRPDRSGPAQPGG
jgi:hypothetical protein